MGMISMVRLKKAVEELADDFSEVVQNTGTLELSQMRRVIKNARRFKSERVPPINSERHLQIMNEIYINR